MDVSAVIKTNTGNGKGAIFHAFSENLQPPSLLPINGQIETVGINDYTVAALLSNFFRAEARGTDLESRYPFVQTTPYDEAPITMGLVTSSYVDPSHSDSVSLACYSEAVLRGRLVKAYEDIGDAAGNSSLVAPLINAAKTMPMDQLGAFLSETMTDLNGGREQVIINFYKQPKLTITRLTNDDFDTLSESFGSVDSPFIDGFDLIKERVTRQESYLNTKGYLPAIYTNNGGDGSSDTIVFTAEYGMSEQIISLA